MTVYTFSVIQTVPVRCYPTINYPQCKMSFIFVFVMMTILVIEYTATHYVHLTQNQCDSIENILALQLLEFFATTCSAKGNNY